ncbi:alpha/beta hydrolase family esterase [Roseobacter sp. HKCCA0434]|uniref:alpha/beta hydrolase family esterase n=1 Tax=Roseobacter sp. HKCCA0434 TaxID=3079297 RepID=UPI002905A1BF|nr:prolyl oligopeptidase family serine peptidase [Roseobacter sp. HKCCA0434]
MSKPLVTLGLLLGLASPLAAQVCGGPDDPCRVDGGFYHAALPDAAARGAVVFLHGYGGRAAGVVSNAGLMQALAERGYAVIAPQGMPRFDGDAGGSWNSRAGEEEPRDDVGFVAAVADDAAARFGLPRDAMVLAGFSGGAMMTWRAACDAPGAFAAYAPVAGTFWRPMPTQCAGAVRLHHTHGTSDRVVPLAGRTLAAGVRQGNVSRALATLREGQGCADAEARAGGAFTLTFWRDCAAGELALTLHDGGHAIPRGWSAIMLDWFEDTSG